MRRKQANSANVCAFRLGAELASAVAEEGTDEKFTCVSKITSLKVRGIAIMGGGKILPRAQEFLWDIKGRYVPLR